MKAKKLSVLTISLTVKYYYQSSSTTNKHVLFLKRPNLNRALFFNYKKNKQPALKEATATVRARATGSATALQLDWETIANRFELVIRGAIQSAPEPRQNSQVNVPRPIPSR